MNTLAGHRTYKVGLVGESNYRTAIRSSRAGERVRILHEVGNPYDDLALVVLNSAGEKLGYIPSDCWLREAVHQEEKGCLSFIYSINRGADGREGVVIELALKEEGTEQCAYRP